MSDIRRLHDTDFFAWTRQQAEALRAAARPVADDAGLDWHNLIDEIESLGMSERSALHAQVRRVLHHLMKLEASPATAPRNGWRASVRGARVAIESILDRNPSLRRAFPDVVATETRAALKLAMGDLEDHGEEAAATALERSAQTYDPETRVLSDWWPA